MSAVGNAANMKFLLTFGHEELLLMLSLSDVEGHQPDQRREIKWQVEIEDQDYRSAVLAMTFVKMLFGEYLLYPSETTKLEGLDDRRLVSLKVGYRLAFFSSIQDPDLNIGLIENISDSLKEYGRSRKGDFGKRGENSKQGDQAAMSGAVLENEKLTRRIE
ncbi:hypothetical protein BDZ45DRAFT_735953 [Acephala macrosclerotiorum]|nr:hypothetical protein BDZ45DRAFT_735953 [Acephala macrosclerotiorum]